MSEQQPSIQFGPNANQGVVSVHTIGVLTDILRAAACDSCIITSTSRTPAEQARIMFSNIKSQGVAKQKALYAAAGDSVIDEFVRAKNAGKSDDQIRAAMEAKIRAVGPEKVSHHCADPAKLNVVDIAPSSIAKKQAFQTAVNAAQKQGKVSKFLTPGNNDPAFHIEIPQPTA
ncbi:MAG: hypothetical protein QOC61_457 [Acidobacteriota bacterium]|jgi:hypothetical protein|nr:hypothetical protein [Acidobacteriota bacterium]MDT7778985.1 hypothetical protein [Acidobacteriota bacterium]